MSTPQPPKPAKLVVGLFTADKSLLEPVARALAERFGPVDMVSPWMAFDYTDYYRAEMGGPLFRRMMAFERPIEQEELPKIKHATNEIERAYAENGGRAVNIDPGYLLHERFVLATGKNFTHRIYIGENIYADLTLIFQKGRFQTLPWTYPDYGAEEMIRFLLLVRGKYALTWARAA